MFITFLALDYSINYSTICILKENSIKFHSIIRDKKFTKKEKLILEKLIDTGIFTYEIIDKVENINELRILDAENIAKKIIKIINENKIKEIAIEGFSFNSIGRSLSDVYGYQYIFRYLLLKNNIMFKLFSPATIKKIAGKGNFNKLQMVESFIKNENNYKNLNILKEIYINYKSNKLIKPLDDIVDSFWVLQTYLNFKLNLNKK
jgi:Holliday junction resolvasome RuvABC endonuclease subunit